MVKFHIDKMNNLFVFVDLNLLYFHDLLFYLYHHMRSEIIQMLPTIIMTVFNTSISYCHKNSFHYLKDYLMTKLALA